MAAAAAALLARRGERDDQRVFLLEENNRDLALSRPLSFLRAAGGLGRSSKASAARFCSQSTKSTF
jgi:hypothetical protein